MSHPRVDRDAVSKEEGVSYNRKAERPWYNLVNSGGIVVDVYARIEYAIMACDKQPGSYVREIHPTLETSTIVHRSKARTPPWWNPMAAPLSE